MPSSLVRLALIAALLAVVAAQVYRGLTFSTPGLGATRAEQLSHHDFRWVYVAGKAWLRGESPHIPEVFVRVWEEELGRKGLPMAHVPTFIAVTVPVALFGWDGAYRLYDLMNILAYVATLVLLVRIAKHYGARAGDWRVLLALVLVATSSTVPGVIYAGQASMFVMLGLAGMMYFGLKQRLWIAALFMVLASIKPQVSLLPFLWLCVWWPGLFLRSVVTVGATSLLSPLMAWDPQVLEGFFRSLAIYRDWPTNQPSFLIAVHRLFGRGPVEWAAPLLGVVATIFLARRFPPSAPASLAVPLLLAFLLMPVRGYDFGALVIPVFLLLTFAWSWWYVPMIVLVLRPNAVIKIAEHLSRASSEDVVVYAQGAALALCLALVVHGLWRASSASGRAMVAPA